MSGNPAASTDLRNRRELLARIARLRRRIDRRVDKLVDRSLLPWSWRAYVRRRPGRSLLAAAAAGFALSRLFHEDRGRGQRPNSRTSKAAWARCWKQLAALAAGRASTEHDERESEASDG
jgi:hypothetical protein